VTANLALFFAPGVVLGIIGGEVTGVVVLGHSADAFVAVVDGVFGIVMFCATVFQVVVIADVGDVVQLVTNIVLTITEIAKQPIEPPPQGDQFRCWRHGYGDNK
jgi:hypothetical protein